jgi:hypothetical protein
MGTAIAVRTDYSSKELRRLAGRVKNAGQARRLLAIAAVLDGVSRDEAARIGGMDRQTLRDAHLLTGALVMTDVLLAAILRSSDRTWLEQCRDHNVRQGRKEVAEAAKRRLRDLELRDALRIKPEAHTVEDRVLESVRVYRELLKHKHGRNQAAGYTEREIRKYGPREALIRTIRRGRKTDGLKMLAEHDRLDCTYEQIAMSPEIALGVRDEPISFRDFLSDRLPDTQVGKRSMHEDDRLARPLVDVLQADSVHFDLFGLRTRNGSGWNNKAQQQRCQR